MAATNASGANAVCANILTQAQNEFTININNPEKDTTALNPTVYARSFIGALGDWSVGVRSRLAPALIGSTALISNASGMYNANVRRWSLTISNNVQDSTAFNATAPTWRSFINGIQDNSGSYEAFVDDTTALVAPGAVNSAVVFRYYDAATDYTLSFDCLPTQVGASFKPGDIALANYSFKGSGVITNAGAGTLSSALFAAAMLSSTTVILPVASSFTGTAATGRTYSGNVLLERMTIDVPVDDLITIDYQLKGTGACTIA